MLCGKEWPLPVERQHVGKGRCMARRPVCQWSTYVWVDVKRMLLMSMCTTFCICLINTRYSFVMWGQDGAYHSAIKFRKLHGQ